MEKDIIQPVNISILNDMLKEQEQKYEKKIAELEDKIKELNNMTGIFSARMAGKLENKLKKIKEYLEQREDIAKSMNELQTIQGIYNILGE